MQIPHSDTSACARTDLRPGHDVRVRGARWRVADVRPFDACRIVTLTGLTPPHLGLERRIIDPFDRIEPIERDQDSASVRAGRWRRACCGLIAGAAPPGSLVAPLAARIDLMPHQLEPAMALLAGAGSRVLLADEVGLGKTIEAALIVAELRARGSADRVLVLTPAGLRDQWQGELRERFDIDATNIDAPLLRRLTAALPIGVNPWTTIGIAIASVDYVKRAEVLPAVGACRWDVVIIDEAHGVANDSERRRAARMLASQAAYVLLLTATPHSGDDQAFAALRDIGSVADPDPLIVFRRTRGDVQIRSHRRVRTIRVRLTMHERRMHRALARYADAVRAERRDAALALSVLHKRAFSSAWSLGQSVARRLAALDPEPAIDARQIALPLGDSSGETTNADEAPAWPDGLELADAGRERRLLEDVASACRTVGASESKIAVLARLLRRTCESVLVFTEYRDTLLHLQRRLSGLPIVILHGGLTRDERSAALAAFDRDARTILLATDAAGEGLNLHNRCRLVVNLELPWNPMRLEQRIGRVDRIGQRRSVHAIHLVARGTGETRILNRLKARVMRAHRQLGAPDPFGIEDAQTLSKAAGRSLIRPDTRDAASVEAERLRVARAFAAGGSSGRNPHDEEPRPSVIRARRLRRLRVEIGSKALLIWRMAFENADGRVLASRIVATSIEGVERVTDSASASRIVRDLASRAAVALEPWSRECHDAAETFMRGFAAARLARERAIASGLGADPSTFQPGLFDRRAERARRLEISQRVDAEEQAANRIRALEQSTLAVERKLALVLAVLP